MWNGQSTNSVDIYRGVQFSRPSTTIPNLIYIAITKTDLSKWAIHKFAKKKMGIPQNPVIFTEELLLWVHGIKM